MLVGFVYNANTLIALLIVKHDEMPRASKILPTLLLLAASACVISLAREPETRLSYVRSHDLDDRVAKAITQGKAIPGMTRDEVEAAWGPASSVDKSESFGMGGEWGREEWSYRSAWIFVLDHEATVQFNNGKVVDVSPAYLSDLQ